MFIRKKILDIFLDHRFDSMDIDQEPRATDWPVKILKRADWKVNKTCLQESDYLEKRSTVIRLIALN